MLGNLDCQIQINSMSILLCQTFVLVFEIQSKSNTARNIFLIKNRT